MIYSTNIYRERTSESSNPSGPSDWAVIVAFSLMSTAKAQASNKTPTGGLTEMAFDFHHKCN